MDRRRTIGTPKDTGLQVPGTFAVPRAPSAKSRTASSQSSLDKFSQTTRILNTQANTGLPGTRTPVMPRNAAPVAGAAGRRVQSGIPVPSGIPLSSRNVSRTVSRVVPKDVGRTVNRTASTSSPRAANKAAEKPAAESRARAGLGHGVNGTSKTADLRKVVPNKAPKADTRTRADSGSSEKEARLKTTVSELSAKLDAVTQELEALKKNCVGLQSARDKLESELEANEENFEMLTIDKEFLEEENQELKTKLQDANEQLLDLQEQFKTLQNSMSGSSVEGNIFERTEMLEEAIMKLKAICNEKDENLESLRRELKLNLAYKTKYFKVEKELEQSIALIEDLKLQLDSTMDVNSVIEDLTDKNFVLQEKCNKLSKTVEELEDLRDLANDLEEAHLQTEKELNNDLSNLRKTLQKNETLIESYEKKIQYYEGLIKDQNELFKKEKSEILNSQTSFYNDFLENNDGNDNKVEELSLKLSQLENIKQRQEIQLQLIQNKNENLSSYKQILQKLLSSCVDEQNKSLFDDTARLLETTELLNSISKASLLTAKCFTDSEYWLNFCFLGAIYECLSQKYMYDETILDTVAISDHLETFKNVYLELELVSEAANDLTKGELEESWKNILRDTGSVFNADFESSDARLIAQFVKDLPKSVEFYVNTMYSDAVMGLKYLNSMESFILNDGFVPEEELNKVIRLQKSFGTVKIILQNLQSSLKVNAQVVHSEYISSSTLVTDWPYFVRILGVLQKVNEKIEYEHLSITSELAEKKFENVFEELLHEGVLDDFHEFTEKLCKALGSEKFEVKEIKRTMVFEGYMSKILHSKEFSDNKKEIGNLQEDMDQLAEQLYHKDELISQLELKIDLLKQKVSNQQEQNHRIDDLETKLASSELDLQRQKVTVETLRGTIKQQNEKLAQNFKEKNFLGKNFDSIYEEKKLISNLRLISEIQVQRNVINYLMKNSVQAQSSRNLHWLEKSQKVELFEDYIHNKNKQVNYKELISLGDTVSVLKIDRKAFSQQKWKVKYICATVDKELQLFAEKIA